MIDLRKAVERRADPLRPHLPEMTISSDDPRHCRISAPGLQVDVYQDYRDGRISSTLTWTFGGEQQEPICTLALYRMVSDDNDDTVLADAQSGVESEIERLTNVLEYGRKNGISPRDWLFYFYGYNAAYSRYAFRRSEPK